MTQCEFGDMLVSIHGASLMYLENDYCNPFPHLVVHLDEYGDFDSVGSITDEGWVCRNKPLPEDHDIKCKKENK